MGHGFGELYKLRGIITYKLSPFELKAFHGYFSGGLRRTMRKISDNFFYVVPPFTGAYILYDQATKEHHRSILKNPADFENDQ